MPSAEQLRSRLVKKLSELFQLDQPDLDFGFYRIMHAKSAEVQDFITTDLLKIVADAFGDVDEARKAELKAKIDKEIAAAKEYGVADPENSPKVKEAEAAYETIKDTGSREADVYDHLYRFFERYYDDGDFISRRYYTRETPGKAAPFAVPYNGEEVKLHWANADQYYIKSAEYFSNFTFDLTQSAEIGKLSKEERILRQIPDTPLKVHFRVVEATEGEHGNVKASEANKRFFILHAPNPVALTETGKLVVNFEYRPDPEKSGQEGSWRDRRNGEAVDAILDFGLQIADLSDEELAARFGIQSKIENLKSKISEYIRLFKIPAPTDSDKKRPVLAKYVNQYTARNTMDYFIHKDLGGFLRRELDFYIKNEVMRLDDIENAEAPAVESYLAKLKVLRKIAGKLIDFLAQLEDFQKKLWLKKKFIIETNYCITIDRIVKGEEESVKERQWLAEQIANNDAQIQEWIKLGFIEENEIDALKKWLLELPQDKQSDDSPKDLFGNPDPNFTLHPSPFSLHLVLDTRFFDDSFKARLVASIENFDEQCDGLLIHSDNFQAINSLQERYRKLFQCIYIDPPYNSDASPILYKNGYRHSSWVSLIADRLDIAKNIRSNKSVLCVAIDDYEYPNLFNTIDTSFPDIHLSTVVVRSKPQGRPTASGFSTNHEYAVFWGYEDSEIGRLPREGSKADRYPEKDHKGIYSWANFRKSGSDSDRSDRKKSFYPLYVSGNEIKIPQMEWDNLTEQWNVLEPTLPEENEILPIDSSGNEKVWTCSADRARKELDDIKIISKSDGSIEIHKKYRPNQDGALPGTWWDKSDYSASESGTKILKSLFGGKDFDFPKSINLVIDNLRVAGLLSNEYVCDYFAGSGTTGHAVISLNREDDGKRKFFLVEMGDYFDTVLKPRIAKVVYSENWKDGKPTSRHTGISHCCKYIRLESYEDTLNNLRYREEARDEWERDFARVRKGELRRNRSLREDYMLHYLLEVETRGSQSLLNIDRFVDPWSYTLRVKKPGSDEQTERPVDLVETFNYLIGLRVAHISAPQWFDAEFERVEDPEVPAGQKTKLAVSGRIRQVREPSAAERAGLWRFQKIEGWLPKDSGLPNNGQQEKVLVVWRSLPAYAQLRTEGEFEGLQGIEGDNLMLDEWFQKMRISTRDFEFDTIYVNGSNNLPNLALADDNWKVRLIEEEFMKRMWDGEGMA